MVRMWRASGEPLLLNFCRELERRKLIASSHPHQLLETANTHHVKSLPAALYAGFDPTAPSLHVGNLLVISNLLRSSLFGCSPIALIGGTTALVGDPVGRSSDRPELSRDVARENSKHIVRQLAEILENGRELYGERIRLTILNNADWYENMSMIDFMAIGHAFRVGEMMRMGPVRARLESGGLSFAEFSYQLLQSFDWYVLSRKHDCYFQLGGSDQLGHVDSGADYIKRRGGRQAVGVCLPLVSNEHGVKLGKSTVSGDAPVWLDAARTSPFALFQYFRQLHDDVAERLLTFFSLRPLEDVNAALEHHRANLGKWIAQQTLAEEVVGLVHGRAALDKAIACSNVLFGGSLRDFEHLDHCTIAQLFTGSSTFHVSKAAVKTVAQLADATRAKGASLVDKGAFKINGVKATDPTRALAHADLLLKGRYSLVCWGKRRFCLVDWAD